MYLKSKNITIKIIIIGFFSKKMVLCDSNKLVIGHSYYTMYIKYI